MSGAIHDEVANIMLPWTTILQNLTIGLVCAIGGGLWAMYIRVIGHSEKIMQLQKETSEHAGKLDVYDTRLRAIENTTIRIDTNVAELLRTQRQESPTRAQGHT